MRLFQGGPRRLVRGRRPGWRAVAAACASRRLARPGIQKSGRLRSRGKIARGVASSGFGRGGSAPTGRTRPASGARAAGRWRRALRPAHMACEAGPAPLGPASTREEAYGCAGRPRRCARASPLPGGEAGLALPAPVACAERWPLAALCRELKMEDAAARESGRAGESPAQREGPCPPRPLLPVIPAVCPAASRLLGFVAFGAGLLPLMGEGTRAMEFPHTWWVETRVGPAWRWL